MPEDKRATQRTAIHHARPSSSKGEPANIACGYPFGATTTDWAKVTCKSCLNEHPDAPPTRKEQS